MENSFRRKFKAKQDVTVCVAADLQHEYWTEWYWIVGGKVITLHCMFDEKAGYEGAFAKTAK